MIKNALTLIVAVYNLGNRLIPCLECLMCVKSDQINIIIIDDGSNVYTKNILKRYKKKLQNCKIKAQKNSGIVSVRKAGLLLSNTEFVAFMDGDDFFEPGYYEELLSIAIKYKSEIVIGAHTEWDATGIISVEKNDVKPGLYAGEAWNREKLKALFSSEHFYTPRCFTFLWNKVFRTDFVAPFVLGVPNTIRMGEDAAVTMPALYKACNVFVSEASGYMYVQHNASMMKKNLDGAQELENIRFLWRHFLTYSDDLEKFWPNYVYDIRQYLASLFYVRAFMNFSNQTYAVWPFPLSDQKTKIAIVGKGNYFECLKAYLHNVSTSKQKISFFEFNGNNLSEFLFVLEDSDCIILANINPYARLRLKEALMSSNVNLSKMVEPSFEMVTGALASLTS